MRIWSIGLALAAAVTMGACVPGRAPPAPEPASRPVPRLAPPAPAPVPPPVDWEAGPLSGGDWLYSPSPTTPHSVYRSGELTFIVSCERRRAVALSLGGVQGRALTIRTSYGERRLPTTRVHNNYLIVELPPSDPLLEQMAFSRGRFLVGAEGGAALVLPAWPELARVVEDCRGL